MTATNEQKNQTDRIEAARELLAPSEVRHHHVPNWFRLALLKAYGTGDGWTNGPHVLQHAVSESSPDGERYPSWLDHWGSTKIGEALCFVAEPYNVNERTLRHVASIAARIGCRWWLSPNSWWYPGSTIRIVFAPAESN